MSHESGEFIPPKARPKLNSATRGWSVAAIIADTMM